MRLTSAMVAVKFVDEGNVHDEVGISSDVGALNDQVTLAGLTILFHDGGDVAPFVSNPAWWQRASTASRTVSWADLVLLVCFLHDCT